jgi:hypothetical protein
MSMSLCVLLIVASSRRVHRGYLKEEASRASSHFFALIYLGLFRLISHSSRRNTQRLPLMKLLFEKATSSLHIEDKDVRVMSSV